MKKILSILAILVLLFSLVACDNNESDIINNEESNNQEVIENIEKPVEKEKFYSVDEVNNYSIFQFIRLNENPTTGYR